MDEGTVPKLGENKHGCIWPQFSCNVSYSHVITSCIRGCIQKFPDWRPGARTANGTVSQSSEFCRHNSLYCVVVYFIIDSVQKLLDTRSYEYYKYQYADKRLLLSQYVHRHRNPLTTVFFITVFCVSANPPPYGSRQNVWKHHAELFSFVIRVVCFLTVRLRVFLFLRSAT